MKQKNNLGTEAKQYFKITNKEERKGQENRI